jgi:hypothetical protein
LNNGNKECLNACCGKEKYVSRQAITEEDNHVGFQEKASMWMLKFKK